MVVLETETSLTIGQLVVAQPRPTEIHDFFVRQIFFNPKITM